MTPAEHYESANMLIKFVKTNREHMDSAKVAEAIAIAQVHATLANAPLEQIEVIQR